MRTAAPKIVPGAHGRADRLRSGRAAAPTLRDLSPGAHNVSVRLQFCADELPAHAEQGFTLYPSARAYFEFACPYGGCDGVFNLAQAVNAALGERTTRATGTVVCQGVRPRQGIAAQPCGLAMDYTVTAEYEERATERAGRTR